MQHLYHVEVEDGWPYVDLLGPVGQDLDSLYHEFRQFYDLGMTKQYCYDFYKNAGEQVWHDMFQSNLKQQFDGWKALYERGGEEAAEMRFGMPTMLGLVELFAFWLVKYKGFEKLESQPWLLDA